MKELKVKSVHSIAGRGTILRVNLSDNGFPLNRDEWRKNIMGIPFSYYEDEFIVTGIESSMGGMVNESTDVGLIVKKITPIMYRPIIGSLRESMIKSCSVYTWDEFINLMDRSYYEHPLKIDALYEGFDDRIGWESFLICAKMPQYETNQAACYLNQNPNRLEGAPKVEIRTIGNLKIPE